MSIRTKDGNIDYKKLLIQSGLYLVLLIMLVLIIIKEPSFLSIRNFKNILTQSSVRLIIALGVAGLIVTTGTDLSVGRQVGFSAVISATLLQAATTAHKVYPDMQDFPLFGAIAIVMLVGMIIGALNGLAVAKLNLHPFIVTMGSMTIVYGINSLYYDFAGGSPIAGFAEKYTSFAQGYINIGGFTISYLIFYALIATVIMWILWNKTKFGKYMFAVGGNPEAAKVSGVNVIKTQIMVYAIAGMMYAFAAALEVGRIGSASNTTGNGYEMDAVAACVIGGVSLSGGVGSVGGIVIGVLMFTVINYGLAFIGVNMYWQYIVKGLIILLAVIIDMRKYAKRK